MSVYAQDGAVIFGVQGKWQPGQPPSDEWMRIRSTFWNASLNDGSFILGDFAKLARFFALSQATEFRHSVENTEKNDSEGVSVADAVQLGDDDAKS